MALPQPSTPLRLPRAITTYSPATQDPDLRSQINTALLRERHVEKISDHLTHSLHASPTNWPSHIRAHALALLRSGECNTFPALMERVMADIKRDTLEESEANSSREVFGNGSGGKKKNGVNGVVAAGAGAKGARGSGSGGGESLAVPKAVVEDALKVTRECLELVCEVDD